MRDARLKEIWSL